MSTSFFCMYIGKAWRIRHDSMDVGYDGSPTRRLHLAYATTMLRDAKGFAYTAASFCAESAYPAPSLCPTKFSIFKTNISWESKGQSIRKKHAVDDFTHLHTMIRYAPDLGMTKFPYSSLACRPPEPFAFLLLISEFEPLWTAVFAAPMFEAMQDLLSKHITYSLPIATRPATRSTCAYALKGKANIYHIQSQPPEKLSPL